MKKSDNYFIVVDKDEKWHLKMQKPFTDADLAEDFREVSDERYPETGPHRVIRAHVAAKDKEIEEQRKERDEARAKHEVTIDELVEALKAAYGAEAELSALKAKVTGSEKVWLYGSASGEWGGARKYDVPVPSELCTSQQVLLVYAVPVMSTQSPHQQNVSKNKGKIDR